MKYFTIEARKSKLPHPRHPLLEANSIMIAAALKTART